MCAREPNTSRPSDNSTSHNRLMDRNPSGDALSVVGMCHAHARDIILSADESLFSLQIITAGAVGMVVTPVDPRPITDAGLIGDRHLLVSALSQMTAFLPVRLGVQFDHRDTGQAWLATMEAPLMRRLEQVTGCVEYGVRVVAPVLENTDASYPGNLRPKTPATAPPPSLTQPLGIRTQAAVETALHDYAHTIHTNLTGIAKDIRHVISTMSDQSVLRADILAPIEACPKIEDALASTHSLIDPPEDWDVHTSGPWPAYAFATLADVAAPLAEASS